MAPQNGTELHRDAGPRGDAGLLRGRRILVTGVLTQDSIAFGVARFAQQQGARVVLTSFGRGKRLTERIAQRLPEPAPVIQLDVTSTDDLAALAGRVAEHVDGIDGILHSIAYAPPSALGDGFLTAPWTDAATAIHVSAYSLKALTVACLPLMNGGSVVGLDFDATVAWPNYAWMGVAKAALESVARYLARELGPAGIRVNLVSAGPVRTMAAKAVADFGDFAPMWKDRAPLGWDPSDAEPVARACVALLSDLFPATTGEIVHVDGGFHAMGQ
jgi:meromycolic acid enoyl-[acyl-carrier-protein] reductase